MMGVLLVLATVGGCASPVTMNSEGGASSAEAQLIALENEWIAAEVNSDGAALERILDEQFLLTFSSGKTIGRTEFIDVILAANIAPFTVIRETIRVHGDTALVIDLSSDGRVKFTWVAVKRDGQWRIISETMTSVAEKK
jgi:hypothetical protein